MGQLVPSQLALEGVCLTGPFLMDTTWGGRWLGRYLRQTAFAGSFCLSMDAAFMNQWKMKLKRRIIKGETLFVLFDCVSY